MRITGLPPSFRSTSQTEASTQIPSSTLKSSNLQATSPWNGVSFFEATPGAQGVDGGAGGTTASVSLTGQYQTYKGKDGESLIHNNVWGTDLEGADKNQSIDIADDMGGLGFTVHANHGGDASSVKSYPFVGTGWHFGEITGTKLPRSLSSIDKLSTEMTYDFPKGTKGNFAEEAWLYPPGNNNPKTPEGGMELMVRHAQDGLGNPGKKLLSDAQIGGKTYDVYYDPKFPITNAQFLNFVEKGAEGRTGTNTTSTDWKAITDFATDPKGPLFPLINKEAESAGVKPMDRTWNMLGLEAGFELSGGGEGCKLSGYKVAW